VVAEIEDTSGSIEVTVWPRVHENTRGLWVEGALVIVKGQLRGREGQLQVSCQNAQRYTPGQGNGRRRIRPRALILRLRETGDCQAGIDLLDSIMELLGRYPGEESVSLVIDTLEGKAVELEMPEIRVALSPGLERELGAMPADLSFRIA
jgi:DNA polymerase III alpha subunit